MSDCLFLQKIKFLILSSVFCRCKPLTFFLLIFIVSCEKEFPVSDYREKDKLVLNCFITNDTTFEMSITKTKSPYSIGNTDIDYDKCKIELFDQNNRAISFVRNTNSNLFEVNEKLLSDQYYSIYVSYPGFEMIGSETWLPGPVNMISYTGTVHLNTENEQVLSNRFVINPGNNKYMIIRHIVNKKAISISGDTISFTDTSWISNTSQNIMSVLPANAVNTLLFAQLKKNEQNYLEFDSYDGFDKENNIIEGYSTFEFISCSEDYYKYISTLEQLNWNKNKDDSTILLPMNLFSNIKNGYGIFAGFAKTIHKIKYK